MIMGEVDSALSRSYRIERILARKRSLFPASFILERGFKAVVETVDKTVFPNLEKALRRRDFRFVRGKFGDVKFIMKTKKRGRTQGVFHIVIDRSGNIDHFGIKGIRLGKEKDILFRTPKGTEVEFDIIGGQKFYKNRGKRK